MYCSFCNFVRRHALKRLAVRSPANGSAWFGLYSASEVHTNVKVIAVVAWLLPTGQPVVGYLFFITAGYLILTVAPVSERTIFHCGSSSTVPHLAVPSVMARAGGNGDEKP